MIRIYLDWDIISKLKTGSKKFQELNSILKKYKNRIFIPFSNTHFQDLKRCYKKGEDNLMFYADLKLLSDKTKNQYLQWETDCNVTRLYKTTPKDVFADIKESWESSNSIEIENSFNELFSIMGEFGLSKQANEIKNKLSNIPIGDKKLQDNIGSFFGKNSPTNLLDYYNKIAKLMSGMLSDKEVYKENRNKIKEGGIILDKNQGNWNENEVFDKLEDTIMQSELKMSFDEIIKYSEKNFKNSLTVKQHLPIIS